MCEHHSVATNTLWKDSYFAYIPLLGAAVALAFDAGCFYALGINFYTLFSLSEHIAFAIPAFPIALIFLFMFSALAILAIKPTPRTPEPSHPLKNLSTRQRIVISTIIILVVSAGISLLAVVYYPIFHSSPEMLILVIEVA
jgi:hypothetical protein